MEFRRRWKLNDLRRGEKGILLSLFEGGDRSTQQRRGKKGEVRLKRRKEKA